VTPPRPSLSLVIPVFNEAGNLAGLADAAIPILAARTPSLEVLFVNDGSTDGTGDEITRLSSRWPQCRELRLPDNRGQAVALLTGLHAARGDLLLTMDGDGQNDPRDFPALLDLVESGHCDLACGWRVARHDTRLRQLMSRVANFVRRAVLHDGVHDAGCQLRVMRRKVLAALEAMELLQSFIPALAVAAGLRVAELPVTHHPRRHGVSKYGLARLWWRPAVAMLALRRRLARRQRP
jgi:dolichol-phosphate mannosyltransferase